MDTFFKIVSKFTCYVYTGNHHRETIKIFQFLTYVSDESYTITDRCIHMCFYYLEVEALQGTSGVRLQDEIEMLGSPLSQ